ncbi:ribonuclease P protein component [Xenophilus arseniciresistens]|uniref:Ribonuclease P protein component n=1 Tax=Xenophilus arseniciresistens TaxID=1283306 RepID=A0AAE3NBK3_9BURK|nr:ribonuclease P protein component [Xenophilus arseniciresistens]MDA7418533.1 ribonuclease P protein component [Xenophilus arseniciresistens]
MRRLKTRAQFQAALSGSTVARTAHFALHRCNLLSPAPAGESAVTSSPPLWPADGVWLGAMVPKRWARRAVTRNAIRRQIYALADAQAHALPQAAHVVRLRAAFDRSQFPSATSTALKQAVRTELQQLFARAARNSGKGASASPAGPRGA